MRHNANSNLLVSRPAMSHSPACLDKSSQPARLPQQPPVINSGDARTASHVRVLYRLLYDVTSMASAP